MRVWLVERRSKEGCYVEAVCAVFDGGPTSAVGIMEAHGVVEVDRATECAHLILPDMTYWSAKPYDVLAKAPQ